MSGFGKTVDRVVGKVKGSADQGEKTQSRSNMPPTKVYLRALPLRTLDDVNVIKREVKSGNILILRVSPIAKKNVKDIKRAVNELCRFTESVGGDIARLGEERVVITPSFVRIWREKSSVSGEETATAA